MIPGITAAARRNRVDPSWASVISLLHLNPSWETIHDQRNRVWTLVGNAALSSAQSRFGGSSLVLDGSGDYLHSTDSAFSGLNNAIYTIEGWAYLNQASYALGANSAAREIFTTFNAQANGRIGLQMTSTGVLSAYEQSPSGTTTLLANSAAATCPQQQWFHWAVVRDLTSSSGVLRLFLNGVLIATSSAAAARNDYQPRFRLGALDPASGSFANWWLGYIDEVRVTVGVARYTTNFTPPSNPFPDGLTDPHFSDVVLLAGFEGADGATTYTEESIFARTTTFASQAHIETTAPIQGASSLELDGTDDLVSWPDAASLEFGNRDFTIECSIVLDATPDVGGNWVLSKYTASGNLRQWAIYITPTTIEARASANGSSTVGANWMSHSASQSFSAGNRYDIAWVRRGDLSYLFVNGALLNTAQSWPAAGFSIFNSTNVTRVGGAGAGSTLLFFDGRVDELRITHGVGRYVGNYVPQFPFPRT